MDTRAVVRAIGNDACSGCDRATQRNHERRAVDGTKTKAAARAHAPEAAGRLGPVTGATCNRLVATFRRARTLAMDKPGLELPRLTFPDFTEEPAGRYVSPEEFHAILAHMKHPTKRAFVELLYLLGIRPGQLK